MEIDVRIENPTDEAVQFYNAGIVCSGNDEFGGTHDGRLGDPNDLAGDEVTR